MPWTLGEEEGQTFLCLPLPQFISILLYVIPLPPWEEAVPGPQGRQRKAWTWLIQARWETGLKAAWRHDLGKGMAGKRQKSPGQAAWCWQLMFGGEACGGDCVSGEERAEENFRQEAGHCVLPLEKGILKLKRPS